MFIAKQSLFVITPDYAGSDMLFNSVSSSLYLNQAAQIILYETQYENKIIPNY